MTVRILKITGYPSVWVVCASSWVDPVMSLWRGHHARGAVWLAAVFQCTHFTLFHYWWWQLWWLWLRWCLPGFSNINLLFSLIIDEYIESGTLRLCKCPVPCQTFNFSVCLNICIYWILMLFHGFDLITLIIYFDALIVSELASGSLFKQASVSFWLLP